MYMCGGKMKYDLGGMMMPGVGGSISAGGDLIGSTVDAFAMKNNDKPYTKKSVASGALKGAAKGASTGMAFGPWGAAIGGVVGGAAGALSTKFGNDASQQAFQQQQQEAIKQQLISNLPAQSNYVPTFADGGDINNNSFVTNWLSNRKDILKSNLGETSLKNYVSSNPNAINDRLNLYQNKISSTSESINPNLPSNVNGVTYTKGNQSRIEYPSVPLPQTRTHEQVHAAGITPDVSNTIKRITGLDYNKPLIDVQTPNELYPRLMEMRQVNQLDPTKQYSPEDVVKFRQVNTSGKKNALFDYFDDATISKLLNEVAMNETDNTVNMAANGGPIKQREDFKGNWLRYQGSGGRRRDSYGELGDLYRYYAGDPLKYNALYKSEYKPTNSKDPNAEYISIKNKDFADRVVEHGNRLFIDKNLDLPSIEQIELEKRGNNRNAAQWKDRIINEDTIGVNDWRHPLGHALGRYFVSKGKDDKGEYLSYYDEFDVNQPGEKKSIGDRIGATKPFEIYDRIYVNKDSSGHYTRRNTIPQIENSPIDKTKLKPWETGAITYATGGEITDRVKSIDNGTLHSENGGVPIGQNALVERGEYLYKNKQGKKYVFTDKF